MLPIPDAKLLLEWASIAPWDKLFRFTLDDGARGHSEKTKNKFVEIFNKRRWIEEGRVWYKMNSKREEKLLCSVREKMLSSDEKLLRQHQSLEELRNLSPLQFERSIAALFNSQQGFKANVVGGPNDQGIDVEIYDEKGDKWGVAQCKKYQAGNSIGAKFVLEFGGAYLLSGAKFGFLFTTSKFTKHAKRTAQGYPWLVIYNGSQLVNYIEEINRKIAEAMTKIDQ